MPNKDEIYKCEICGNVVYVIEGGDGDLVCCGEEMKLLQGKELDPYTPNIPKPGTP